jgi:hypothetical protein
MHNSDPTPQGVENRNILLWFKMIAPLVSSNSDMLDCAQKISTPFGSNYFTSF